MGLIVLGALALYFLLSIAVVAVVARQARKRGRSVWRWGGLAALAMYLLVFWDHIPTVLMHRYYCEKEAGFWVYKTVEEWKKENPGVMETLVANKGALSRDEQFNDGHKKTTTYLLNERFNWVVTQEDISSVLPIIRTEQLVTEVKRKEVLARYIDFATGNSVKNTIGPPGPLKFWLWDGHCEGGNLNSGFMWHFTKEFKGGAK